MTKTTWALAALLVATNAAWGIAWLGGDEPANDGFALAPDSRDDTIAALESEVERLRAERVPPAPMGGALEARGPETAGTEGADPDATTTATQEQQEALEARRAAHAALQKKRAEVTKQVEATLRKVMQIEDPALRQEGMDEMVAALRGDDAMLTEYTLSAIWSAKEIPFDKSLFTGLIEPLLRSENAGIRRSALYAIHAVDRDAAEVGLALASARDPDPTVRQHAARIMRMHVGKAIEGESADAIAGLLRDESAHVRKGTLRALWGTQVNETVESQLLALTESPADRHDAVYFGLSTLENKSKRVVDALFAHLQDKNHGTRSRAHWGLQRGVAKELQPYVAKEYASRLTKFVNPNSHREALKLIVRYGDTSVIPALSRFADNEMAEAGVRDLARRAAAYIEKRAQEQR